MSSVNIESQQQQHQQQQQRRWYLLMDNPSKTNHLGTLLRCAAAFQCHQVLLVGYDKFNWQGSFGSHIFLDIVVFPTWDSVHEYLMRGGDDDDCANNANDTTTTPTTPPLPPSRTTSAASTPLLLLLLLPLVALHLLSNQNENVERAPM